jgi:hypothetical protein
MNIHDIIMEGKMRRSSGIREIKDFFDWHFCHLAELDVRTAKGERLKYESIWIARMETLRMIASGRLSIDQDEPTLKGWRFWIGKNLRDIAPDEYTANYEIPQTEAMLERIAKLGKILTRLEKIEANMGGAK